MSVQFGTSHFEGQPPSPNYIEKVSATLAPYGPDGNGEYSKDGVKILYRAFHTTKESHRETQPHISASGAVIAWDGRLDNRVELVSELRDSHTTNTTDVELVAGAYEKWGTNCFAKLIGDWALSICNPINHSVILAKDPIGSRHLYYWFDDTQVTWCTILEPFILFAGRTFNLCEEYVAGWLACFPAAHLTPYIGIHAVPPSSYVLVRPGKHNITKYWDFDPHKRLRYRTDSEYEEHFRSLFATAIRRRLRSDRPVLAELSGGMDSSSIVCMADCVIARGEAGTPLLDTISYYDDSDPTSDELAYLTRVEQKRGRVGYHINLRIKQTEKTTADSKRPFFAGFDNHRLAVTPDSNRNQEPELLGRYSEYLRSREYRVILSGIAGEVPTGGYVPTPMPELQNLLARARVLHLIHQAGAWAHKMRKPPLQLLWQALRGFFTYSVTDPWAPKALYPPRWLDLNFVKRNKAALLWYPSKLMLFGALPSFQHQVHLLEQVRRFLAFSIVQPDPLREIRYPYLDRNLLEFAGAIPREQMVGVGKRRFLMKRALTGIVPDELLNRKRKDRVTQRTEKYVSTDWPSLAQMGNHIISGSLGIVDPNLFLEALQHVHREEEITLKNLKRTILLESWVRHVAARGVLTTTSLAGQKRSRLPPETKETSSVCATQRFS